MLNPLKIQEPALLEAHNAITECFVQNNLPFKAEYQNEPDPNLNSVVHYVIQIDDRPRAGFIAINKGVFGGVIFKNEKVEYLQKEGFTDEQVFEEPIFARSPCVLSFVSMLAFPKIKELKFSEELWRNFDRIVKTEKKRAKQKARTRKKKGLE
jgi:hypothetical protein